jgi:FkbM family methyltransferase
MERQPLWQRIGLAIGGRLSRLEARSGIPLQRLALKLSTACRLPNYLRRLGVRAGAHAWWSFLFSRETVYVRLPGHPHPVVVRCDRSDPAVFERIFIAGEYDAIQSIEACRSILDCGAYVGYSTLFFARRFPEARVVAVEPDEENLALLRANTAHCANVVSVHGAVWSHRCAVRIKNAREMPWSFAVEEGGALPATTVEELVREHELGAIDLLKIDIEGAEREVFRAGYESWLPAVRMLIIELHDYLYPGSSRNFFAAVRALPFRARASGENVVLTSYARPATAAAGARAAGRKARRERRSSDQRGPPPRTSVWRVGHR